MDDYAFGNSELSKKPQREVKDNLFMDSPDCSHALVKQ